MEGQNILNLSREAVLDLLQDLLVLLAADERDGQTLGAKATGTTNTVKVRVGLGGQVVVDGNIDTLNINTTAEDVGGNTDTTVELLELLVAFDTERC